MVQAEQKIVVFMKDVVLKFSLLVQLVLDPFALTLCAMNASLFLDMHGQVIGCAKDANCT